MADDQPVEQPMPGGGLTQSFVRVLLEDVYAAQRRQSESDSQSLRRDLVRTIFAAIEGLVWIYRQHVTSIAGLLGELQPLERQALSEVIVRVTDTGKISQQPANIALIHSIRLTSRIALRICPSLTMDFGDAAWNDFRIALKVRNRITHPKQLEDLNVRSAELRTCEAALGLLADLILPTTEAVQLSLVDHAQAMRTIIHSLKAGDPVTTAEYQRAAADLDAINRGLKPPYRSPG